MSAVETPEDHQRWPAAYSASSTGSDVLRVGSAIMGTILAVGMIWLLWSSTPPSVAFDREKAFSDFAAMVKR